MPKRDVGGVGTSKSWTAKLLSNPSLLREKIREEAGELCDTQEHDEGRERTASEMADLLYHSMVLLNNQVHALHPTSVCLVMSYSRLIVIPFPWYCFQSRWACAHLQSRKGPLRAAQLHSHCFQYKGFELPALLHFTERCVCLLCLCTLGWPRA